MKRVAAALILFSAGCSGGGGSPPCPGAQRLTIAGYRTGATAISDGLVTSPSPFPSTATFLYFSVANVTDGKNDEPEYTTGAPTLAGSDGSTIVGGSLAPVQAFADVNLSLFGYSSSVAGLTPNVTYSVSFASLDATNGCRYGAQGAGTFRTD